MMKSSTQFLSVGIAFFGIAATVALAQDTGVQSVIGNVFLQNSTPGTAQAGHATISGTFRAGQVNVVQSNPGTIPVIGNQSATGTGTSIAGSFSAGQNHSIALRGTATSTSGNGIGVYGESRSSGPGIKGVCLLGQGVLGTGSTGVTGSGTQVGVLGTGNTNGVSGTGTGNGGFFTTTGTGIGVVGISYAPTGLHFGGQFTSASTSGTGAYGLAGTNTGTTYGVQGVSLSTDNGYGVFGSTADTGTNYGVYGLCNSPDGYGMFAEGRTGATGTKSFVIDHPLDPTNKYLQHYTAEGPEPRNVYQGAVTTGADGFAWVSLPDYYAQINRDPLIQLTVSDDSQDFVMVKVSKEVQGNRFQIRTSKPKTKVFWRVDAVRNDRWVQKFGYQAEPKKPTLFRGTYLQPELYGQPQSLKQLRPTETKPVKP